MAGQYSINIEPEAVDDIQKAVDYYNSKKTGLGKKFYNKIDKSLNYLKKYCYSFSIRYDDIRCMPLKNFPYMIHYIIQEKPRKSVSVIAVFSTYENPEKWEDRLY